MPLRWLKLNFHQVEMAQKTMIADMKEVIESMHEAKQLSSTSVDRQFRQVRVLMWQR